MGANLLYTCLFRLVLPAGLIASVLFRYNLFSFIYLLLLLIQPLLPPLKSCTYRSGSPRKFIIATLILSTLICLAHIVFQIYWLVRTSKEGEFYLYCSLQGKILFNIGLNRLDNLSFWLDGVRLVGIDFLVFLMSVIVYLICEKSEEKRENEQELQAQLQAMENAGASTSASTPAAESAAMPVLRRKRRRKSDYLLIGGELVYLILLMAAGILQPSLLTALYFLVFIATSSWLACTQTLQRSYFIGRIGLLIFSGLHFILTYAYQFPFFYEALPSTTLPARLLGLTNVIDGPCSDSRTLSFLRLHWTVYVSPLMILALYCHTAIMTRYRLLATAVSYEDASGHSRIESRRISTLRKRRRSEGTRRLLNEEVPPHNYNSIEDQAASAPAATGARASLVPDPDGSIVWSVDVPPSNAYSEAPTSRGYRYPLLTLFRLIAKGSYIGTLIIMMAWSITYHSWLTFVLLIGSCILWMTPNSRQNVLRSSPFLVAYAEALLLLQYIYSLKLTEKELPSDVSGISMSDIGIRKYHDGSYQPLATKIFYTGMFWLTLWFYLEEEKQKEVRSSRGDGAAGPSLVRNNPWLVFIGHQVSTILAKYWIWIVACMLMVISLGGHTVVIYRIVYMVFFLSFIILFQFSYHTWRKVMKTFWVMVIIYSMFVLLLIYIYQFKGVPDFLIDNLGISKKLQEDFGLEIYLESGVLLSKLLTPTFFLIITIIQLHYFHQQFLIFSNINYRPVERELTRETIMNDSPRPPPSAEVNVHPRTPSKLANSRSSIIHPEDVVATLQSLTITTYLKEAWEIMWRSLEIHVNKIVLFSMICLAIFQATPLHLFYIVFVLVALPVPRFHKFFCHCGALWTAFLLILQMIYQLKFTKDEPFHWETNCTNMSRPPFNESIDNLRWIGLQKSDDLVYLSRGYIGIIVILTLQTVTYIRQRILRYQQNLPDPPPGIIFPEINRSLADRDLVSCAKYLANYCFYKFGLEICFITSVVSISIRLDFFALIATLWIFSLFLLPRYYINKVWPFYIIYQTFALAIQFILMVGLSPGLCFEYPWAKWENTAGEPNQMQKWFFLPSYTHPQNPHHLVADIFLLIFSYCQLWVFAIERGPNAEEYKGGSNKELTYSLNDYCSNPVSDFVVRHKSYLDILKVFVFFSFYWITLAILFMAGARSTRISIFALGYVVGCFFFLWSGNEFYLRPRPKLIRMWNSLLVYNLVVVLFKIIFQLVIPTYQDELKTKWWIVQLVNNNAEVSDSADKVTEQALIWDAVCFAFLLFQRRIFCSNYFQYVVMELKAQQILASRGAELINQRQTKIIQEQRQKEKDNMEKIKKKMDKIRDQQKSGRYIEPKDHYEAIRSGDYYLFEEVHAADLETLDYGHTPTEDHEVKQKGINALISQTMKGTYNPWQEPGRTDSLSEGDDVGESSRLSPILSVDRTISQDTSTSAHQPSDQPPATSSPLPGRKTSEPAIMSDVPLTPESPRFAPDISFKEAAAEEPTSTEAPPPTFCSRLRGLLFFTRDVLNSIFISCTDKLNRISKDYRYVAERLTFEKMLLKQKLKECTLHPEETSKIIAHHRPMNGGDPHNGSVSRTASQIRLDKILESVTRDVDQLEEESKEFKKQQPAFIKLVIAMWYALISQSEILCFLVIIIYQINSASVLSLPLPLLAFLWGTLTVPRPTKLFWITIITYTECIVISKYLFQFNFWPWNREENSCAQPTDPYKCPPLIIGVSKDNYRDLTIYDLMLLLAVFFHRFMLKSFGLWRNSDNFASEELEDSIAPQNNEGLPEEVTPVSSEHSKVSVKKMAGDDEAGCAEEEDYDDDSTEVESKFADTPFKEIFLSYVEPIKQFFCKLLYSKDRLTTDVYAYMFFCDFINFLILVFGYNSFGMSASGSVKSYLQENRIPVPFLAMLLAQFATIVVDRALYLRKNILGKLVFQIVMVVLIHIWMFFLLPSFTHKPFYESIPPKLWYIIKSVYFLLSAYQIRLGYPLRILGNFFCKKYNYLNLVLFKLYKAIPFLWELRCLMDWIWTNTSLAVSNWFKMEDIFSHIFVQKCFRRAEEEYPFPRGTPRPPLTKYGIGGTMLIFLILIVWFPLVFFALGNTVGRPNPPTSVELEVTLEGFQPLFTASAQADSFHKITDSEWMAFNNKLRPQTEAITFLSTYEKSDVTIAPFRKNSLSTWSISPPSRQMLVQQLTSPPPKEGIKLTATITFTRSPEDSSLKNPVVKYENPLPITNNTFLSQLGEMINGSSTRERITLYQDFLPLFLEVGDRSSVQVVPDMPESMRFVSLSLQTDSTTKNQWWQLFDANCTKSKNEFYSIFNLNQCDDNIYFIAFNKKIFPAELGYLSNSGIIGLYTTFVLVLSRVIRSFFFGAYKTIMFDEMPNVDRVLELCLDIYLVRENQELALEEDLFAKLIFLYRSPETLIKWTRPEEPPPNEPND